LQVKQRILQEFAYQSSHDLAEETYDMVRGIEPAWSLIKQVRTRRLSCFTWRINVSRLQARSKMVQRLNSYANDYKELFGQVSCHLIAMVLH
jgi:hypothetical protein